MATITWKIESMEWTNRVNSLAKVVSTVRYVCAANQDDHICKIPGDVSLSDPDASAFTAYDGLTESQVIAWVKASLGSSKVTEIETTVTNLVQEDIDTGNSYKHTTSLPW